MHVGVALSALRGVRRSLGEATFCRRLDLPHFKERRVAPGRSGSKWTDRPQVVRGRRSSRSGLRPDAKAKAKKADAEAKATKVAAAEAEALRLEQERTAAAEAARIAAEEEAAMAGTAKKTWYRSRMPGRDRPEAVHKTL
jgi:pyruvate/2-oxoglutarate dehydrogenase complex dihydrolipoamide acyltransferase (E2) component